MVAYSFAYAIPYLLVFLVLFVFSIPLFPVQKDAVFMVKRTANYSITALLVVFIGFRGFVLGDCLNYYDMYSATMPFAFEYNVLEEFSKMYSGARYIEKGFVIFMSFFRLLSGNYMFFQAVTSTAELIILYNILKNYNEERGIILGFVFFVLFAGITVSFMFERNYIAIILFLLSVQHIKNKKIVLYMCMNLLGAMFHASSFFYLPLYFVLNKKINKKIIFFLFVTGNIFFIFKFKWLTQLLLFAAPYLPDKMKVFIAVYSSNSVGGSYYGFTLGFIERIVTFIIVFCLQEKLYKKNADLLPFINSFWVYIMIFLFCSEFRLAVERVAILLVPCYWILYPNIYRLLKPDFKKMFLLLLFLYGIIKISTFNSISHFYDNILFPYKSYIERRMDQDISKGLLK
jgi:hypothetical protein